jgi:hypothetical protein
MIRKIMELKLRLKRKYMLPLVKLNIFLKVYRLKKMVIILLVLLLVGCNKEEYCGNEDLSAIECIGARGGFIEKEEMRPQYREWDSQDNVILYENLASTFDKLNDRFNEIEKQIHDLDDFGVEENSQDIEYIIEILENIGRPVILHWGVANLEREPHYWTANVFNYSDDSTVDYTLTIFYEDDSADRFVFDNLNELYDNYNYLIRAYR